MSHKTTRDHQVLKHLKEHFPSGTTRRALADHMGIQTSTISGCVNRLLRLDEVHVDGGTKSWHSGKMVQLLKAGSKPCAGD